MSVLSILAAHYLKKLASVKPRMLVLRSTSRLSRRIVFAVFLSIIVIEFLIIIPSVQRRKWELLNKLTLMSTQTASTVQQLNQTGTTETALWEQLQQLEQPFLIGGVLYTRQGRRVGYFGERPELPFAIAQSTQSTQQEYQAGARYDISHNLTLKNQRYTLVLRYDTSAIWRNIYAYIGRIVGLVAIISLFVTISTAIVLQIGLINPILKLRADLIKAGKSILEDQDNLPKFDSTTYPYDDEMAEVIRAFHQMVGQVQQAIAARKKSEADLHQADVALRQKILAELQKAQVQLIQSEKMSALGNLVAGIAHEINNPVGFLSNSVMNASDYTQDLLTHVELYQQLYPEAAPRLESHAEEIDLEFLRDDLPKLLASMAKATDCIKSISSSLRTFSRADTEHRVNANLHEGIDSTLLILTYRLKANEHRPAIQTIRNYGELPPVECFLGQLNQVFMNILANAIDVFDEAAQLTSYAELQAQSQTIVIQTEVFPENNRVEVRIADNGKGMSAEVQARIFDRLFTTKGVGKGTGLGLAIAHQVVTAKHHGRLDVKSELGQGTEFIIQLPIVYHTDSAGIGCSQRSQC